MFIYYYIYVDNALEKSTKQVSELTTKTQTKARPSSLEANSSPPEPARSKLELAKARTRRSALRGRKARLARACL